MNLRSISIPLVAAVAALAVGAPFSALAQDDEAQGSLSTTWILTPKKGMAGEFEEAVKAHVAMREENDDTRSWQMYSVAIGDKMDIYQVRYCCFDWADQDAYIEENADKNFSAHFNETVSPYVDRIRHYFERMDMENSAWPEDDDDFKYYGVTSWVWEEDAGMEVDEVRKEFSQIAIEHGWGEENPWLWLSRIGGKPMIMLVAPFSSYADMAPPEQSFFEFLIENTDMEAEDVGDMFETFGDGFESSDYTVWVHRPDLSMSEDD